MKELVRPTSGWSSKMRSRLQPIILLIIFLITLQSLQTSSVKLEDLFEGEKGDDDIVFLPDEDESDEIVYTPEEIENIVTYGEDCSSEGPFCDARLHLACDKEEEICVCDDKNGYVHVGTLKSLMDDDDPDLLDEDDYEEEIDLEGIVPSPKKICMKSSVIEHKVDRLLNITKKIKDFTNIFRKYKKYLPKKYQDLLKEEL